MCCLFFHPTVILSAMSSGILVEVMTLLPPPLPIPLLVIMLYQRSLALFGGRSKYSVSSFVAYSLVLLSTA